MKNNILLLLLLLVSIFSARAQKYKFENNAVNYILRNKHTFVLEDSEIIFINKNCDKSLSVENLSSNNIWKNRGLVQSNCLAQSDSINNLKRKIKYTISKVFSSSKIILVDSIPDSTKSNNITVFKRFYHCGYCYILIRIENVNTLQYLALFKLNKLGNILDYGITSFKE